MIGYLRGRVVLSDGREVTLLTQTGVGYRVKSGLTFAQGQIVEFYIAHIIKESSQELYGFSSLLERNFFELLLSVKGVGAKGAYNIIYTLGVESVVNAIEFEDKKMLQKAPGIGAKVAAQILLDLREKIAKMPPRETSRVASEPASGEGKLLNDALLACSELGFSPDQTVLTARKILDKHEVTKSEQLVHLILKEM